MAYVYELEFINHYPPKKAGGDPVFFHIKEPDIIVKVHKITHDTTKPYSCVKLDVTSTVNPLIINVTGGNWDEKDVSIKFLDWCLPENTANCTKPVLVGKGWEFSINHVIKPGTSTSQTPVTVTDNQGGGIREKKSKRKVVE